jgi:molybdate transport system regulatory protein
MASESDGDNDLFDRRCCAKDAVLSRESKPLFTRSKVWIVDAEGNVVFGTGRLRTLKAIKRCGSIHAAAKELKIGYRAVWGRIQATESRLGAKLLEKTKGGAAGGGSRLTPLAESLIERFDMAQRLIEKETDALCNRALGDLLNLNSEPE